MTCVDEALRAARGSLPASEARLLLAHVLQRPMVWVMAHGEAMLDAADHARFLALAKSRQEGQPIAYLLGRREFHGRDFLVSPAVLIPRPETELLVEIALEILPPHEPVRVLELGTGSGCIAITLALERPAAVLTAVDASTKALAMATDNAARLGARVNFLASNWFSALNGQRFDLIVGNPPYIAAADPHLDQGDLRFEPVTALASGADGLDDLRVITSAAGQHLVPGGCVWLEHGYDQATAVHDLLVHAGFGNVSQRRDIAGIIRASGARWPE